jgi:hypothetical protein
MDIRDEDIRVAWMEQYITEIAKCRKIPRE